MYDLTEPMIACNYCGATNVLRHKHHTNRCVDCGKLYDRYRKARRRGIQSEMLLCGDRLLQRSKQAAETIQGSFYAQIEAEVNQLKEELEMSVVTHKVCKQCGRDLPIGEFRKYTPRGKGIYNTKQGHNTICKTCEAISSRASTALSKNDADTLEKLRAHYKTLQDKGYRPVTAAAKRVLGVDIFGDKPKRNTLDDMLSIAQGTSETAIEKHCRLVRQRGYTSFEEADAAHRRLADELLATDPALYGDITDLLDEWYMEE